MHDVLQFTYPDKGRARMTIEDCAGADGRNGKRQKSLCQLLGKSKWDRLFNFCAQRRLDVGFEKEDWRRTIQEDSGYLNWGSGIESVAPEQDDCFWKTCIFLDCIVFLFLGFCFHLFVYFL
jgi:hypothetical protein